MQNPSKQAKLLFKGEKRDSKGYANERTEAVKQIVKLSTKRTMLWQKAPSSKIETTASTKNITTACIKNSPKREICQENGKSAKQNGRT